MLKKALGLILLLLSLLIGLLLLVVVLVDPNDYKAEIEQQASATLGREFSIGGDIGWDLWPGIGIQLTDIQLNNPQGMQPSALFFMQKAKVGLSLLPLLQRELVVDEVWVEGIQVNLITTEQGESSLDGLGSGKAETTETAGSDQPTTTPLSELYVGGVTFKDINILIEQRQTQSRQQLQLTSFRLSELALGQPTDASLEAAVLLDGMAAEINAEMRFTLKASLEEIDLQQLTIKLLAQGDGLPEGELKGQLTTQGDIQLSPLAVNLQTLQLGLNQQIQGKGSLSFQQLELPILNFDLAFDAIDLDSLLPAAEPEQTDAEDAEKAEPEVANAPEAATEPDLQFLKTFELDGKITIAELLASNLKLQNIQLPITVKQGILQTKPAMDLYAGKLSADTILNGQQAVAGYQVKLKLDGVQLRPLLTDAAGLDMLAGQTQLSLDLSGVGLLPDTIKQQATGKGQFMLADGALYGVNLPQMLRNAKARLTGAASAESDAERKTDFTSMTGSFTLDKGVLDNPDLAVLSPLLRLQGKGQFNLLDNNRIDYQTLTEVVGSLEGQGAQADDLAGVKIPLHISGTPDDLNYSLDMKTALESKATAELKQKADAELEKAKDKLKNKLNRLFGG